MSSLSATAQRAATIAVVLAALAAACGCRKPRAAPTATTALPAPPAPNAPEAKTPPVPPEAVAPGEATGPEAPEQGEAKQPLSGTVRLRGGLQLTGDIQTAEFGVMHGAGVGSSRPGGGYVRLDTGGAETDVRANQIRTVDATWENKGLGGQADWRIASLRIVTRDGRELSGLPTWKLHATTVVVLPPGAKRPVRVHAFPMGRMFKEENLLVHVELAGP